MDEKRKGSDFLSFFKFFTTCLVPCVFSITFPVAKEMSSILTTAYCVLRVASSAFQLNKCSSIVTESILLKIHYWTPCTS